MKTILAVLLVVGAAAAAFAGANSAEVLPGSNEISPTVAVSTAVTPVAVVVSSYGAATRVDTVLNAAIVTALGANGYRAGVQVQKTADSAGVYYGFNPAMTTASGFLMPAYPEVLSLKLGKGIAIYTIADGSTTIRVGGFGFK